MIKINKNFDHYQFKERPCPVCRGRGFVLIEYIQTHEKVKVKCNLCMGSGYISEETYNQVFLNKKNPACPVCGDLGVISIAGSASPCPKCNPIAHKEQNKKHFPPPLGNSWWNT